MTDPIDEVVDAEESETDLDTSPGTDPEAELDTDADTDTDTDGDADADQADATSDGAGSASGDGSTSVEELLVSTLADLEQVTAQRDEYLDLARRVQADFENYKRRVDGQRVEQDQRAAASLVVDLLPVLDACDAALGHGAEDVGPIQAALLTTLSRLGLSAVAETEVPFDPEVHEAVLTEEGDGADGPVVAEVMRTGYAWNGRVVRPAMVKVRG